MTDKIILVTGATGFIGRILCDDLRRNNSLVREAVRSVTTAKFNQIAVGDIGPTTDWTAALDGVDTIVHLAARVHIMREIFRDPLKEYRQVNVQGTEKLARMAAKDGVKKLIFLSTIGVNGKKTSDQPYTENDPPVPHDTYAISKWEAEIALKKISAETDRITDRYS